MALDPTYDLSSGERSADGGELQQGCCVSIHEVRAQRCGRLGASPPPLAAEPGLPGFGHFIDWPKSETSDFGWRVREGACTKIRASLPPPHRLPRKRGREEPAARASCPFQRKVCATVAQRRGFTPPRPPPRRAPP